MTAISSSQKAYLYETSGSAKSRDCRRNSLDYKLEGHHATLACRNSESLKGKFSLSVGRKIDLSKETQLKEIEKKKNKKKKDENFDCGPVILPQCSEDFMDDITQGLSREGSVPEMMRGNTDDVPLTTELLQNEILSNNLMPAICSECAKVGLYTKHESFKHLVQNECTVDSKQCDLCQKRNTLLSRKSVINKQEKTLLMSIVYPHDFYDRYQSARRQFQNVSDDCEKRRERKKKIIHQKMILPKPTFTLPETVTEGDKIILKPHVVRLKEKEKHKKENLPNVQNTEPEVHKSFPPPLPSLKSPSPTRQPKHLRCQPQMKAYFVASMSKHSLKDRFSFFGQRSPLKGFMLTKNDRYEKPKTMDTKHCKFSFTRK
jgi:hypothetical protein